MVQHFRFETLLAWRFLKGQRKNFFISLISLFSMLGACLGTAALVIAFAVMNGFEEQVITNMIGKDAHLEIIKYHNDPIDNYDSLIAKIKTHPNVTAAAPMITYKVGISSKKMNDGIVIYGIDTQQSKDVISLFKQIKYGYYTLDSVQPAHKAPVPIAIKPKKIPGIILGYSLASRLGIHTLEEKLILQTFQSPDKIGLAPPKLGQFATTGFFESGMYEYDANIAYISLESAQKLLNMPGQITGIQVKTDTPMESQRISQEIKNQFLHYPFTVMDWQTKNQTMIKWMALEKVLFGIALSLIIIIAAFNIISSLTMIVQNKTQEVGILRAMGCSQTSILRVFVLAGGMIGITGTLVGMTLGISVCALQAQYGFIKLPPDVYLIPQLPIKMLPSDMIIIFVVSNFLCLTATILPAWKASRMDPVGAIRHE